MKYMNTKTGFVFESKSEVSAEGWVALDSLPTKKATDESKPAPKKRTTKK